VVAANCLQGYAASFNTRSISFDKTMAAKASMQSAPQECVLAYKEIRTIR
jgi:hypothetical protein